MYLYSRVLTRCLSLACSSSSSAWYSLSSVCVSAPTTGGTDIRRTHRRLTVCPRELRFWQPAENPASLSCRMSQANQNGYVPPVDSFPVATSPLINVLSRVSFKVNLHRAIPKVIPVTSSLFLGV